MLKTKHKNFGSFNGNGYSSKLEKCVAESKPLETKVADDSIHSQEEINLEENIRDSLPEIDLNKPDEAHQKASYYQKEVQLTPDEDVNCNLTQDEDVMSKISKLRNAKYSYSCCIWTYQITASENDILKLDKSIANCGKFCKFLTPEQQYNAVFKCKNYFEWAQHRNQEYYIVPASWWREWCDFINVEYNTYTELLKVDNKPNPKRMSNIVQAKEDLSRNEQDHKLKDSFGDSLFVPNNLSDTFEDYSQEVVLSKWISLKQFKLIISFSRLWWQTA